MRKAGLIRLAGPEFTERPRAHSASTQHKRYGFVCMRYRDMFRPRLLQGIALPQQDPHRTRVVSGGARLGAGRRSQESRAMPPRMLRSCQGLGFNPGQRAGFILIWRGVNLSRREQLRVICSVSPAVSAPFLRPLGCRRTRRPGVRPEATCASPGTYPGPRPRR